MQNSKVKNMKSYDHSMRAEDSRDVLLEIKRSDIMYYDTKKGGKAEDKRQRKPKAQANKTSASVHPEIGKFHNGKKAPMLDADADTYNGLGATGNGKQGMYAPGHGDEAMMFSPRSAIFERDNTMNQTMN